MGDAPSPRADRPGLAADRRAFMPETRDHRLRKIGFRLALLTSLTVVAFFLFVASTGGWSNAEWPFALWAVAYAAWLVLGWRTMRPLAVRRTLFALGASGLLVQGVTYLVLWLLLLASYLAEYAHFGSTDDHSAGLGAGLPLAALVLMIAGPLVAVVLLVSARGAGRMFVVQLFGAIGFFCIWSYS